MRGEVAELRHGRGSGAPALVAKYADALCRSDTAYVTQHTDAALGITEEDVEAQFQKMRDNGLDCTSVSLPRVCRRRPVRIRAGARPQRHLVCPDALADGRAIAKVE
ncbi:MAG: hypothetical protein ACRDG6_00165 [Candidatus Limnocylindria bacterium]